MKGKLNFKEGEIPKVLADNVMMLDDPEVDTIARYNAGRGYGNSYGGSYAVPEETHTEPSQPVKVRIPQDMEESDALQKIKEVLMKYPGDTPVYIYLKSGRTIRTGENAGVRPSADLLSDLGDIVLNRNVRFAGRVVF